ncbi:response regulator transcription factor [Pseudokineococcus basanitobsidens]|uniref:Response regulator transcription factor n=1 Tax=Pseudokineococcus basanitobsidens TaxID=1926649 RepID=A0ABU8RHB1_9ACTN
MSTVLVCDDVLPTREALRRQVGSVPGVSRTAGAAGGGVAARTAPGGPPDVVVMSCADPRAGEHVRSWMQTRPQTAVIAVVAPGDGDTGGAAMAAGACAILVREPSTPELTAVLHHALAVSEARRSAVAAGRGEEVPVLTEREHQVLAGMSRGRSNGEIGKELFLSEDTVKTHARRLFRKLGAADRAHAVAIGFRAGLVR